MREPLVQGRPAEEFGFKDILYAKKDFVATITWNRPKAYNSYSTLALTEIKKALEDAVKKIEKDLTSFEQGIKKALK